VKQPGERLTHWKTRGKDGKASQKPYVPFGTKGTKSSQVSQETDSYKVLISHTCSNMVSLYLNSATFSKDPFKYFI
jgi:hypothetical protein